MLRLRYAVVAALVSALVPTGVLPVHHLHPATPAHETIVHAHVEGGASADTHSPSAVQDEHEPAVPLSHVMAGGQARHVVGQPAVIPEPTWAQATAAAEPLRRNANTAPTPSPPPRPSAPRAPPA